jgi:ketosteroid isomerase-like protein
MPLSNTEVVRAVVSAINRADFAAAMDLCTEDAVFDWSRRALDAEVFKGRDQFARFFEGISEIFDEIELPTDDITDLGDGVVLLVGPARFKGHVSGVHVEATAANLWTVRDGKVTRFRFYQTREDALADAATS